MADGSKVKAELFALHDLLVADSNSHPIGARFIDLDCELATAEAGLNAGLHEGKLIACIGDGLDGFFIDELDVLVLECL